MIPINISEQTAANRYEDHNALNVKNVMNNEMNIIAYRFDFV